MFFWCSSMFHFSTWIFFFLFFNRDTLRKAIIIPASATLKPDCPPRPRRNGSSQTKQGQQRRELDDKCFDLELFCIQVKQRRSELEQGRLHLLLVNGVSSLPYLLIVPGHLLSGDYIKYFVLMQFCCKSAGLQVWYL